MRGSQLVDMVKSFLTWILRNLKKKQYHFDYQFLTVILRDLQKYHFDQQFLLFDGARQQD